MVFLTRRTGFSAAHRYYLPDLTDDENRRQYGAGAQRGGHGHDYIVEVTVRGETDPSSGLVVNITDLKPILQEEVVEPLDCEFLTIVHPVCRGRVPTCENLSILLWNALEEALAKRLPHVTLHRVRLAESETLAAECCKGDNRLMVLLTRCYDFSAAHRLHSVYLSDEENLDLFGKCNNPYGHGHNYRLDVTLQGNVDPRTGLLVDLAQLDRIVREEVIDRYDHRNLNAEAPEYREMNPTSENVVKVIWRRLERRLLGPALYKVCLKETDRNSFAYYGEGE